MLALLCATSPGRAEPVEIGATPVPMNRAEPERTRVGPLAWRGGLELRASDSRFGGYSGLLVSADGRELVAISDKGTWLTAELLYDRAGNLSGVRNGALGALTDREGGPVTTKRNQDAESLAREPDGSVLVAFEGNHRVWRYPPGPQPFAAVPEQLPKLRGILKLAHRNSGVEALVVLSDGALLGLVEGEVGEAASPGFLLRDGDAWERLTYARSGDFRPTGASLLPDGDVLVLERSYSLFSGVAIRLTRIAADTIAPGAELEAREIAVLQPPLSVDNMEGVAVRVSEAGETLVYLIADDNFNPLQRTLLLVFALAD